MDCFGASRSLKGRAELTLSENDKSSPLPNLGIMETFAFSTLNQQPRYLFLFL
jgi:hypothetical protein